MKKMFFIDLILAFLALAFMVGAGKSVEGIGEEKRRSEIMYLPSSDGMKVVSLGYRNLAADLLWFKTVQYYGGYRLGENTLDLFRHLAEVITDLDPQFTFAYRLCALILAEDMGEFEEGVKILKKGIENNPQNWWLCFEMGFLYYISGRDYGEAERYFELASRMPGANERATRFAASAAAKGGDIETSIEMWKKLAETSEDPFMNELAGRYIEKLEKRLAEEKRGET